MTATDGVVIAVLLAFALWGAMRGPLRQLLSLTLLLAAFALAALLEPHALPLVDKVSSLPGAETQALAWGLSFFFVLVAGGLLLAALRRWTGKVGPGGATGRAAGAFLGATKGAVLLLIVGYALLAWPVAESSDFPSLRRETRGVEHMVEERRGWREDARRSRAAGLLVRGGAALRRNVPLPAWVGDVMRQVDADVADSR